MAIGDESTTKGTTEIPGISGSADESGAKGQGDNAETLKRELEALKAENAKLAGIKEKMAEEQVRKNKKHAELRGKEADMESQLAKLQEEHLSVLARLEAQEKEASSLKAYRESEEKKKQEELAALKEAIPAEKKGLIIESLPVETQLEFIKKNSQFLLGTQNANVFPLPIHKPPAPDQGIVLTEDEKRLLAKTSMSEEMALEIKKTHGADFFLKNLRKK